MRYRVKDYTIEGQMIILPYEITLEDLRLLTNETQEISLCSSMFKNKALIKKDGIWTEIPNAISISGNIITVTLEACTLQPTDKLTIEIDKGDNLSSVENKMEEESLTILNKIDNIDLSTVAKQGENQDATNSAIYEAVKAIPELKNMYAAHFEPNDEGEDTYTMVLPLAAVVDGDTLII